MNRVTLDLDDKLNIQGLSVSEAVIFEPRASTPSGLSPSSSIERATAESRAPRHRPNLELPRHYMLDLVEMHKGVEDVVSKEIGLFKTQSKLDLTEIERLEKEKEAALLSHAEEAAARNNWTVLGTVAQYLSAGASIAIGTTIFATSPWVGGLLLVSGIVGIGNKVIHDTVGWQSVVSWFTKSVEIQKQKTHQIEMGMFYFELGTGLAGGIGGCYRGIFSAMAATSSGLDAARKASQTIQLAGTGMKMTSQIGKGFVEKRMSDLQSRMNILDAHAREIRIEMSQKATDARNMIDSAQAVGNEMHRAIASSEIQDL